MFSSPALAAQTGDPVSFGEIWAYLMAGEESTLKPGMPLSDIGYFGAGISSTGELTGVPDRTKLAAFPGRVHLVVAEVGSLLATHAVLEPNWPLRSAFLDAVVKAAVPYDGVQIDFETILKADREAFYQFLADLRTRLPGKVFSVAVPARTADSAELWDYGRLNQAADRIFVMAYDEHWSGSAPGPVASQAWTAKVASYGLTRIAPDRLIMGLPFYGRAWVDRSLARAYKYAGIDRLMGSESLTTSGRQNGVPYFEYVTENRVKVFFDDATSLAERLQSYRTLGIQNVGFWRLGQEDARVWPWLKINNVSKNRDF